MSTTIESLELEIKSNSTSAVSGINALTQSLSKLSPVAKTAGSGLSGLSTKLSTLGGTSKSASTSFTNLFHKMKMGTSVFTSIGKSLWTAIQKSSDYTENINLFTMSMGQYTEEAFKYANEVSEALGIDTSDWIRNQGVFMTLATGFGVAGDRASLMSEQLTQLGYDISSFFNISYEDAMKKLQSGLSGELEPLRRIGYDLSQARLEATALELGIDKAVSSMTQAEKAELRYYAIMTQVTTVHGDMARTLDAPANQLKVLKSQVSMAAREIGNIFIPALNAVLPYAIAVTNVIRVLANNVATLFGFEIPEVDYSGVASMGDAATSTEDALKASTESAKKLKSYMMGFDELNVINPNEDTSSGSEDATGGGFDFELPTYNFLEEMAKSRVSQIVEEMKEWLGITEDIDTWGELFNTKLGTILTTAGAVGGILLGWKIAEGVKNTVTLLSNLSRLGSFSLGLALVVTGITIGALAIESALTEGLNATNAGALLAASATIIAGGALIGQAFGSAIIGAGVSAIVVGVVGLGLALYDAIENELNITNGLVMTFATALVGFGVATLIPVVSNGMGAVMGAIIGGAIAGAVWIVQNTEDTVSKIGGILSAVPLAVGAILAFTGINVPLGIALMAGGAITMASIIALNTSALSDDVKNVIAVIAGALAGVELVLGAIFAFTGVNIPLGIALMAVGALQLATAIAPNWNSFSDDIQSVITTIMEAVGGAFLVLGAILAFTGVNLPLGIGLIATGALMIGGAIALNWGSLQGSIEGIVTTLETIVGGAFLALGAILAFSGVGIPMGIALMALGATMLAVPMVMNMNALSDDVKNVIAVITTAVSLALLAVGAILAFTGANLPLGIALMASGAMMLGGAILPKWNELSDTVKNIISIITAAVGIALLAVGAILAFSGANLPLGIGLMLVGAASLGTSIALNWNSITEALQGPVGGITALIGGAFLALGAILAFTGVALPLGIALMVLGAASLATVTALNWDSIIEALKGPVGGITALISGALLVLGAILLFTGVGIPLGVGLLVAGAAGLATVATLNWDFILTKIKGIWKSIKKFWTDNIAPVFTAKWWKNLGITCINGLIAGFEGGINGIIGGFETMINWIVDGMNKISFDMPEWLGGGHFGIELPRASFGRVYIPRLAEGGFPEQGQLFIAREAGAEMVGSIGRRTAVANNDQIVSGIASGVSEANEEQNALIREQNELIRALIAKESGVYLDGRWLTNSVEKYQRERGRVVMTGGGI